LGVVFSVAACVGDDTNPPLDASLADVNVDASVDANGEADTGGDAPADSTTSPPQDAGAVDATSVDASAPDAAADAAPDVASDAAADASDAADSASCPDGQAFTTLGTCATACPTNMYCSGDCTAGSDSFCVTPCTNGTCETCACLTGLCTGGAFGTCP
jgi:hypothetical protein